MLPHVTDIGYAMTMIAQHSLKTDAFGVPTFDLIFPSATTENNLETSDVRKSEHFGIAASLLEVGSFFSLYTSYMKLLKEKENLT